MKLTWFGGTTIRLHIGGAILVANAELAPEGIDPGELVSGADRTFSLISPDASLTAVDPAKWRKRRPGKLIDEEDELPDVDVFSIGDAAVLIDAVGEPAVVLLAGSEPPAFGRWADDAVIVLCGGGEDLVTTGTVLLDVARPRLIAIAADEQTLDLTIDELREHLDGVALMSLEPGLALET
jgi:hypothetical protein